MIGQTLSHYRVLEKLGSGGMGEVYVAEDTKLSRKVALKVLPPEMAENAERRARFEREAKAVAALDHPNIVTIYSVEESAGIHFYTMQLVKGKTLTELIPRKGMPLNKFFEIAIPLADAVSAAHEQGIIHRDLKPDNLMVSDEGRLKILDFGLAKLKPQYAEDGASELPTQSATAEGRILGTVAYMSPEQAEGKTVDHRSDIFSIGIILFEMATGERPFKGDTAASLLSSILKDTPQSATAVNPAIPRDLGKIVRRCLEKNPEDRLQAAKDLRNELRELKKEVDSGELLERGPTTPSTIPRKWVPWVALSALLATVGTYLLTRQGGETSLIVSELTRLTSDAGQEFFPSLSPDGEFVVYASKVTGNWDIYFKRVGGETALNLTANNPTDDIQPAFSPDGKQIVFRSERDGGGLFLMGATGESVKRLTDFGYDPAWSPDGRTVSCATQGITDNMSRVGRGQIWSVDVASGESKALTREEEDAVQPNWSPNGHRIAFWSYTLTGSNHRDIWTIPAQGGKPIPITSDSYIDRSPVWSPDGRFLYFTSDRAGRMNIWHIPVDEESGEVLGPPAPVTTDPTAEAMHLSLSLDGRKLAYVAKVLESNLWKMAFDPISNATIDRPVPITKDTEQENCPDISPDGEWIAYRSYGIQEDIGIMRIDGTDRRQLTNDAHFDRLPVWSPNGDRIAFSSNRGGSVEIWSIKPDGSGLTQLTRAPASALQPTWSPDGSQMSCYADKAAYIFDPRKTWDEQTPDIHTLRSKEGHVYRAYSWSPDGRWLAAHYRTSPGGVGIYSLESHKFIRLVEFGAFPRWTNDSRSLVFQEYGGGDIYMVNVETRKIRKVISLAPDQLHLPSFSPDNRWIYFERIKDQADIWMLTLNEERE